MKRTIVFISLPLVLFLIHILTLAYADTIICPTIADVYIDELVPDENLNYKTRVLISYHPSKGTARGLFKFDIPMDIEASQIETATLYLSGAYHTGGGYAIDIDCYALNVPFNEGNDTWHTLAGGDYDASVVSSGALHAGNDWETSINVTTLVTGNLEKLRDYGMLIRLQIEEQEKDYQNIASRESTDSEDFPAYIEIVYLEPASSTTTSAFIETTTSTVPFTSSTSTIKPITTTTSTVKPPPPTTTVVPLSSTTTAPSTTTTMLDTSTIVTSSTTSTIAPLCPVETIYGENSKEAEVLQYLRDHILNTTPEGKEIITLYYEWSPFIVVYIENNGELKNNLREIIDEFLQLLIEDRF